MKPHDQHPSRAQLVAVAESGGGRLRAHLKTCAECRQLVELFRQFQLAGSDDLVSPAEDAVQRWINTPLLASSEQPHVRISGRLAFDSWKARPVAVRNIPDGVVRRLRLTARDLALEIVGERRQRIWRFIARVYCGRTVMTDFALKAGRQSVVPGEDGFFTWSSMRPPRTIKLLSNDELIQFEAVAW